MPFNDPASGGSVADAPELDWHFIQAVFYNNPDTYPPIINSSWLLAQAGFRVEILSRDDGKRWNVRYPGKTEIRRLSAKGTASWREYLSFVVKVLRCGNRDASIFIGHDMHGLLPAWLLSKVYRRPLVYHCHDFAEADRALPVGSRMVRAFERKFAKGADLVVVPDADRSVVVASELKLKQPPVVAANSPLQSPATTGEALLKALADRERHYEKILFRQGSIGVGHAIEQTIRSIPNWGNNRWGFVIMGPAEPEYLAHLTAQARASGVEERFVALPPVGYDQVSKYTPGADLGHALYEPIHINNVHITTASNKIMEYMAAGLPLLVSDTRSTRALVERYQCGVVVDEKSPESIAVGVNEVLGDPGRLRSMGLKSQRAFKEDFCYPRQFAPILSLLRRLAGKSKDR